MVNPEVLEGKSVRFADKLYTAASSKMSVEIAGKAVLTLLGSVAEVTAVSRSLAQNLGLPISENVAMNMLAPEGRQSKFQGSARLWMSALTKSGIGYPAGLLGSLGRTSYLEEGTLDCQDCAWRTWMMERVRGQFGRWMGVQK